MKTPHFIALIVLFVLLPLSISFYINKNKPLVNNENGIEAKAIATKQVKSLDKINNVTEPTSNNISLEKIITFKSDENIQEIQAVSTTLNTDIDRIKSISINYDALEAIELYDNIFLESHSGELIDIYVTDISTILDTKTISGQIANASSAYHFGLTFSSKDNSIEGIVITEQETYEFHTILGETYYVRAKILAYD